MIHIFTSFWLLLFATNNKKAPRDDPNDSYVSPESGSAVFVAHPLSTVIAQKSRDTFAWQLHSVVQGRNVSTCLVFSRQHRPLPRVVYRDHDDQKAQLHAYYYGFGKLKRKLYVGLSFFAVFCVRGI